MHAEITAIVHTKNSEKTLSDCLSSLSFCDHILVADDGSIDSTYQIAKRYDSTYILLSKTNSFANKRNQALKAAHTPWIFFVDSDEVVSAKLRESIQDVTQKEQSSCADGYMITRTDILFGKKLRYGETAHTKLLRLSKKDRGVWTFAVHEVWDIHGRIAGLDGELIHTPHESVESFFDKITRYAYLRSQEQHMHPSLAVVQLFFYPLAKFFHNYILRLGFLDGTRGFLMAYMMSLHSLFVRIFAIEART